MLHTCVPSPGTDDDLEYYVRECGAILGVSQKLPPDQRTGKYILEHIFTQIVEFKKFNQVIDSNYGLTVEPLNKGHNNINSLILSFVERLSSSRRLSMY